MPHSKTALITILTLVLPGAVQALGLGEIHVTSALNEPLAAEITMVGAVEDVTGITASIADRETFQRFGIDRAPFLSSVSFRMAMDARGQPVLAIRSTDTFTEPLINLLIDLRWHGGELIREYTLLLDPVDLPSNARVADAAPEPDPFARQAPSGIADVDVAPASPESPVQGARQFPANPGQSRSPLDGPTPPQTVQVARGATLRAIARRVSSRSGIGTERTMIAIFRANTPAFAGNINQLRVGATLTIPSVVEVAKISAADASREVRTQMDAWRSSAKLVHQVKPVAPGISTPRPAIDQSETPAASAIRGPESSLKASDSAIGTQNGTAPSADEPALDRKVQALEKGLRELQSSIEREQETLARVQAAAARANKSPAAAAVPPSAASAHGMAASIAAGLALASVAFGVLIAWRRRQALDTPVAPANTGTDASSVTRSHEESAGESTPERAPTRLGPAHDLSSPHPQIERQPEKDESRPTVSDASLGDGSIVEAALAKSVTEKKPLQTWNWSEAGKLEDADSSDAVQRYDAEQLRDTVKLRAADASAETTPLKAVRTAEMPDMASNADTAKLAQPRPDLQETVHHIPMPSALRERAGFKERRTSLVDALKVAVQREPHRLDLQVKLLQTYYVAAASGRQGFLEVAQTLAGERANMTDGEWGKIVEMGRQIAAGNDLFASDTAHGNDRASCA